MNNARTTAVALGITLLIGKSQTLRATETVAASAD